MNRILSRLALVCILVLILPALAIGQDPVTWLEDWKHRIPVDITNPCGVDRPDHEVRLLLDAAFDFDAAAPDGSDLRITADDESTLLDFWIESFDPAAETGCLWVRLPVLPAAGTRVYVYYDRPLTEPGDAAEDVFTAYDGFETEVVANPGEWARHPGNPVLVEGVTGAWDDHGATFASVIYDSAAVEFRMYYHGFSGSTHQIGLATSPDGLNWTKYAGNPIMTPGPESWDNGSVRVPMVWKEGADYHMIYTGNGSGGMQIGYATSTDGISWTKSVANPVFNDPTWATGETENWGVMKVGTEYQMWYSDFGTRQSGLAISTDLVNWTAYQTDPIFATSGDPGDDRYSQYCPFSFKYGDDYYVLVPSYDSGANYSKFYLYRSASPYFPEADRELVRIAHTVGEPGSWDSHDSDTPLVLTLDIERTQFYNDELWCYYAAEGGANLWKVGLHRETDIAAALAPVTPPVEPKLVWTVSGDVTSVADPVRQGVASMHHNDTSASASTTLTGAFAGQARGVIEAWLRRDNATAGDHDLYLYGDGGSTLSVVAGLGRDGDFHYWNGSFQATGVTWAMDTWYLVGLVFDSAADTYDFTVRDESLNEILRVDGVGFGNPATNLDRVVSYTSSGFVGGSNIDDVRVRQWCGAEPVLVFGEAELHPLSLVPGLRDAPVAILHQNVPNPLNPSTRIRYDLARECRVTLTVYDLQGRRVVTLVDELQGAGTRHAEWNGQDASGRPAATGVYLYRLRAGAHTETRRMVLLK